MSSRGSRNILKAERPESRYREDRPDCPARPDADGVERALDSRCVYFCAPRHHHRDRIGTRLHAIERRADCRRVGPRLLGSDCVHPADGARDHHRPRAGDLAADGPADSRHRGVAVNAARSGRPGRVFAIASSWFNWGFSLVFSAVLAREIARRIEASTTARSRPRASSASAASGPRDSADRRRCRWRRPARCSQQSATSSRRRLRARRHHLVSATRFLWQSFVSVGVEMLVVTTVMWLATPPRGTRHDRARTSGSICTSASRDRRRRAHPRRDTPGAMAGNVAVPQLGDRRVSASPIWCAISRSAAEPLNALKLNIVNLRSCCSAFLLHRTPARLMHAVQDATPAVWGIILQFPFYAGIAGIITGDAPERKLAGAIRAAVDAGDISRRWWRCIRRCWACSCRRADRNG